MIIETCNRSRGINDAWAQASREFVIHRRIENPLRVIRSSLTGGVNRTAVVVLRPYVTLCTEYDWNDTVSRENGHDSETSFIDRDVGTLQERNICPSFRPPFPLPFARHFSTSSSWPAQKERVGEDGRGVVLETRKKTTNVPSTFNPRLNETVFFSFSICIYISNSITFNKRCCLFLILKGNFNNDGNCDL